MAETTKRKWPLPEQSDLPDVVKWVTDLGNSVDDNFLFGPVGSLPATLEPGQVYMGWS